MVQGLQETQCYVSMANRTEVTAPSFLSLVKGLTGHRGRGAEFSGGSVGQLLVKSRRGPEADPDEEDAHRGQTDGRLALVATESKPT